MTTNNAESWSEEMERSDPYMKSDGMPEGTLKPEPLAEVQKTTLSEGPEGLFKSVSLAEGKPSFTPNRVICCQISDEAANQIAAIQAWLERVLPGLRGKVKRNKLHLTLLAINSTVEFKNEISNLLRETTSLSSNMHAMQLRIFRGHVVVTLRCDKASHISLNLMGFAKEQGVEHDPVQTLHITIFRNVGQDTTRWVENLLYKFRFDSTLGSWEAIELFDIPQKSLIWRKMIPAVDEVCAGSGCRGSDRERER